MAGRPKQPRLSRADTEQFLLQVRRRLKNKKLPLTALLDVSDVAERSERWLMYALASEQISVDAANDIADRMKVIGARLPEKTLVLLDHSLDEPILIVPKGESRIAAAALSRTWTHLRARERAATERATLRFFESYERFGETPTAKALEIELLVSRLKSELTDYTGPDSWRRNFSRWRRWIKIDGQKIVVPSRRALSREGHKK